MSNNKTLTAIQKHLTVNQKKFMGLETIKIKEILMSFCSEIKTFFSIEVENTFRRIFSKAPKSAQDVYRNAFSLFVQSSLWSCMFYITIAILAFMKLYKGIIILSIGMACYKAFIIAFAYIVNKETRKIFKS